MKLLVVYGGHPWVTCACQEAVFPGFLCSHSICRRHRLQSQLPGNCHPDWKREKSVHCDWWLQTETHYSVELFFSCHIDPSGQWSDKKFTEMSGSHTRHICSVCSLTKWMRLQDCILKKISFFFFILCWNYAAFIDLILDKLDMALNVYLTECVIKILQAQWQKTIRWWMETMSISLHQCRVFQIHWDSISDSMSS